MFGHMIEVSKNVTRAIVTENETHLKHYGLPRIRRDIDYNRVDLYNSRSGIIFITHLNRTKLF
jgi:hypothetical protein